MNNLRKVYENSSSNLGDSPESFPGLVGVVKLLKEHYDEEDTTKRPSPEDALNYLLDAAIGRFGYSARDVFNAVFNFSLETLRHEEAFGLSYAGLKNLIAKLTRESLSNDIDEISHRDRIVAISPKPNKQDPFSRVEWSVDFKSRWVARNIIQKLAAEEENAICEQIRFLRSIPDARGMAGKWLEPLAHRRIASCVTAGTWPLNIMKSNDTDSPVFSLDLNSPLPEGVQFRKVNRKTIKLQSITDLSTSLEENAYYIPNDPNFPLFDAFTIEFNHVENSAILWVLQITVSRMHKGSALGYQKIRQIIAILKDNLLPTRKKRKTNDGEAIPVPSVDVRYLVVPSDERLDPDLRWHFPKGWSRNTMKNDHTGNVYRLGVPLSVCSTIFKSLENYHIKPSTKVEI